MSAKKFTSTKSRANCVHLGCNGLPCSWPRRIADVRKRLEEEEKALVKEVLDGDVTYPNKGLLERKGPNWGKESQTPSLHSDESDCSETDSYSGSEDEYCKITGECMEEQPSDDDTPRQKKARFDVKDAGK